MTKHNWPEINRAISESIEPKPVWPSDLPSDWPLSQGRAWMLQYAKTAKALEAGAEYESQPRDWREPAAAMELLKRTPDLDLFKDDEGQYVCFADMRIENRGQRAKLPEEAIVLAYYASLGAK